MENIMGCSGKYRSASHARKLIMPEKSQSRFKSFAHAFSGVKELFLTEPNARIHLSLMLIAIAFGFYFHIKPIEWLVLILCFGLVFLAELFNTALETLSDHITPEWNEQIKRTKDLAAAGVLISAITAFIAGLIIFIPYLYHV